MKVLLRSTQLPLRLLKRINHCIMVRSDDGGSDCKHWIKHSQLTPTDFQLKRPRHPAWHRNYLRWQRRNLDCRVPGRPTALLPSSGARRCFDQPQRRRHRRAPPRSQVVGPSRPLSGRTPQFHHRSECRPPLTTHAYRFPAEAAAASGLAPELPPMATTESRLSSPRSAHRPSSLLRRSAVF